MSDVPEPGDAAAAPEPEPPPDAPWYFPGLRFECTACGKCCSNHGDGYEFVYSTRAERKAIAAHLDLSLRTFEARYTERIEGQRTFASRGDACVFLEDGRCTIYGLRPKQCRTFPFWPELVQDRDTWDRDVASFCPGVGQGRLFDLRAIRRRLAQHGG